MSGPGRPTTEVTARKMWSRVWLQSQRLGHALSAPEWDTEVSLVAHCVRCPDVVAVDAEERFTSTVEPCRMSVAPAASVA